MKTNKEYIYSLILGNNFRVNNEIKNVIRVLVRDGRARRTQGGD